LRLPGQEVEQLSEGQNGMTERSYNIHRWYEHRVGRYPSSSTYKLRGPNSNTFAGNITRQCGLKPPGVAGSWHTPGWGDPVPGVAGPNVQCPPQRQ
jgi:hypothetical protein